VTVTDPNRGSDARKSGPTGRPSGDPWGVRRAENLLTSLQGILSARIVVSPLGEVEEVHVLMQGATPAKQVVRNVESALLAHLGLRVDHRKISVAQTAEVRPIDALDQEAVREQAIRRGVLFERVEFRTAGTGGNKLGLMVVLKVGDQEMTGEAEAVDNARARMQAAARAAAAALEQVMERGTPELEGVQIVEAFGRRYVFAGVLVAEGRGTALLTGTCELTETPEQAAVLAVLDATNRWLNQVR
jgi:hypothetical protein